MSYDFLVNDITKNLSQKAIGTDKGLAKIGDGIVNLTYSVAKSIYLTNQGKNRTTIRTGLKVSRNILAEALKDANMKDFARSRANAHDMADTVEALVAYVWITDKITIKGIIDFLVNNLTGNLNNRAEEITSARRIFQLLLEHIKKFLPEV